MFILSTNITSPMGLTTTDNYRAAAAGRTALAHHTAGRRGVPFGFEAALFSEEQWRGLMLPGHTRFESLALRSAREAIGHADIDVGSPRTVFILSTTKGDILTPPGETARRIAGAIGVETEPIVACNACISGVAAQVLALRLIRDGRYDTAIVTGADVQTDFIISGFQALKALSPEPCRPFDAERIGLNLGEAAATIVYSRHGAAEGAWRLAEGAVRNDAFHISGPHPKGEGCLRALRQVAGRTEDLAVVGVHGTATMYNDQMESKAIERAGMEDTPLSALKGYYGHTMGAAGLLETIMTATALDHGTILPSLGYHERGVSGRVTISPVRMATEKREMIKVMSGFGGCNGAIRLTRRQEEEPKAAPPQGRLRTVAQVSLRGDAERVTALYREHVGDYPKFYKMDALSRLAFVATEMLMRESGVRDIVEETRDEALAVILFNRTSSVVADRAYMETLSGRDGYFPSPALFVHTLPNIAAGEIAMRHVLHGETSFYILPQRDDALMEAIVSASLRDGATRAAITGWIDCPEEGEGECEMRLLFGS